MSERSRDLPRRSCLSIPGSSEKMLGKGPGLPADMTFLDLEDAVAPLEKEAARPKVVKAIREQDWGDRVLCVRVNAWDTEWTVHDLIEVVGQAGERLDEIMLPKVQSPAEVVAADLVLTQVERKAGLPVGHTGIEAQIETARGLINVEEICAASPRLETIILGPVDMSASMEMPSLAGGLDIPDYPGDYFHYVFSKILMAGRANGLQVIDGPYVKIRDVEGFKKYSRRARELGFDGKWALHPDQITALNELFSPSQEQFDRACDILDAYEEATTTGDRKGAVMFGDEMVDEASRKVCVKVRARGERAGLKRSTGSGGDCVGVEEVLAAARRRLGHRPGPAEVAAQLGAGGDGLVVDIRPLEMRRRDGEIPGAVVVERNVLEWRLDPVGAHRLSEVTCADQPVVIVCDEGYQSSLAAAILRDVGLTAATDLDGGFQAWKAAGYPVAPA